MTAHAARVVWCERGGRHHGAEIAAADADVHDVRESRAIRPGAAAEMDVAHEGRALRAHGEHFRVQRREPSGKPAARGNAQERVQGGALLGLVDRLAGEECVDPSAQSG